MQKIRPISQNFNEILTFENFETLRFCQTFTYENRRNSLNFWSHLLDLVLSLFVLQMIFSNLGSTTNLKNIIFLVPPSEGGWGKKKFQNFPQNFGF